MKAETKTFLRKMGGNQGQGREDIVTITGDTNQGKDQTLLKMIKRKVKRANPGHTLEDVIIILDIDREILLHS